MPYSALRGMYTMVSDFRRAFLRLSAGTAIATLAEMGVRPVLADANDRPLPPDVNRKFYADGRVMPFAGNTIICHLPQQGENAGPFNALLDVFRDLPRHRFAGKLTPLPPSSYHMTIFGGANDKERRTPLWPADLPLDLPMEECNRVLGERLRAFKLDDGAPPYRMRVDLSEPSESERPITIRLVPIDEAERRRMARLRDRLSQRLSIRAPGHESYRYHVTLAYLIQWLTADEQLEFRGALKRWRESIAERCPVISLGAPEYCTLKDMFAFERQFYLS